MIVPDINLLIYAYNRHDPFHERAKAWWTGLLEGEEDIGLPWIVSAGFVRISTNPSSLKTPLSPTIAAQHLNDWLTMEHVIAIEPGPNHLDIFTRHVRITGTGGNLVTDAHIAAIAIEYDAEVHSADSDFGRFPGLRWHNPLRASTAR